MKQDEQNQLLEKAGISPLAKDKTYGEVMYHRIFDVGLNFWVNLLASGAFTFWVKHYQKPLWEPKELAGKKFSNFGELHEIGVDWLKDKITYLPNDELRKKRADSIVNVFTLQMPGHFIMVPSVWLGAKVKAPIVKYFNRKHYGEEAMHSPDLIARHHAIETEERPTLLGAVVGRLGAMAINMSTSALIGSDDNLLGKLDKKGKFGVVTRGIDPTAGDIGESIGDMVKKVAPTFVENTNVRLSNNYGFSNQQKIDAANGKGFTLEQIDGKYLNGVNDISRFITQDVIYTLLTSSTIHPVVNFARKHLPGLTYKPVVKPDPAFDNLPKLRVPRNSLAQEAEPISPRLIADLDDGRKAPAPKITHVTNESTLTPRTEPALAQ